EVSLGKGTVLYTALERKLRTDTAQSNPYYQYRVVMIACQVYHSAKQKEIAAYRDDLLTYGNKLLPEVMKFHHNYYDSVIQQVAGTIRNLVGPLETIEFVLNRIEKEPAWFRLNNQHAWARSASSLPLCP